MWSIRQLFGQSWSSLSHRLMQAKYWSMASKFWLKSSVANEVVFGDDAWGAMVLKSEESGERGWTPDDLKMAGLWVIPGRFLGENRKKFSRVSCVSWKALQRLSCSPSALLKHHSGDHPSRDSELMASAMRDLAGISAIKNSAVRGVIIGLRAFREIDSETSLPLWKSVQLFFCCR